MDRGRGAGERKRGMADAGRERRERDGGEKKS